MSIPSLDGLTMEVPDREIEHTLATIADPGEACRALSIAAARAGGRDNTTVLVARPIGDDLRPPAPEDALQSPKPSNVAVGHRRQYRAGALAANPA